VVIFQCIFDSRATIRFSISAIINFNSAFSVLSCLISRSIIVVVVVAVEEEEEEEDEDDVADDD
jgi:hypothetical protein